MKSAQNKEFYPIPDEVATVAKTLEKGGFEAYLIGGCVRDILRGIAPKDWDITTNATPEQIISLFPKTFYENEYGTVGVVNEKTPDESLRVVEVTPYRLEAGYADRRRPDSVSFSSKIEDDLKRRDFTINAIALSVLDGEGGKYKGRVLDLYKGQGDIASGIVRAVGDPDERFGEDALRMLRAIRIAAECGFSIEEKTLAAIVKNAPLLKEISKERIRDEFSRILMSPYPMESLIISQKIGVLQYIIPELEKSMGVEQNQAHSFDVWTHLLKTLQHAADKGWSLELRLAALLHDIGKPKTRRWSDEKKDWTFHGHDVVGTKEGVKILTNLKFPVKLIQKVEKLVRWHMFFSDTEKITLSAVRRMIRNVGQENIWDLMNLRNCDRIGTGRPKESPYRLRKYRAMIEEALRDPVTVGMLKIDGARIMEVAKLQPGPKVGHILSALLEEVLDEPLRNASEYLGKRVLELAALAEKDLKMLGEAGKQKREQIERESIKKIRGKYFVE